MSIPISCQEKTGFLILHQCKNGADSKCSACGKYLCSKHTHIHAAAPICAKCLQKAAPEEYQKSIGSRGGYYPHYYGYSPFLYNRYRDSDYDQFDRSKAGGFHEDSGGS